jgi:dihydroneopterin aldolase
VDDIASTVDYSEVAEGVRAFAEARERLLVETFVRELAAELRVRFDLERVEVELKKFILPEARWVAVWHADPPATPRG